DPHQVELLAGRLDLLHACGIGSVRSKTLQRVDDTAHGFALCGRQYAHGDPDPSMDLEVLFFRGHDRQTPRMRSNTRGVPPHGLRSCYPVSTLARRWILV